MDFYKIKYRVAKKGVLEVYPDFRNCRSRDLMVRGGAFYAVWDEEAGMWSTDELRVQSIIDKELEIFSKELENSSDDTIQTKYLYSNSSGAWKEFKKYCKYLPDNFHQLDTKVIFENTEVQKKDYVSKRLEYSISEGDRSAYTELSTTLYDKEELEKLEWCIGSIIAGDSKPAPIST